MLPLPRRLDPKRGDFPRVTGFVEQAPHRLAQMFLEPLPHGA